MKSCQMVTPLLRRVTWKDPPDSPGGRIEVAWDRQGSVVEVTVKAEETEAQLPQGRNIVPGIVQDRFGEREIPASVTDER